MEISRKEVGSKTSSILRLCQRFSVGHNLFENSISGIPLWFYSLLTILSFPCSHSGVSWVSGFSEKVLVVIICFGKSLYQVHVLLSACCPTPAQSPEEAPTGLCLYLRLFSFLPTAKKVPFYVKFPTVPLMTSSNLIKLICGKVIMREKWISLLALSKKKRWNFKKSWYWVRRYYPFLFFMCRCFWLSQLLGNVT